MRQKKQFLFWMEPATRETLNTLAVGKPLNAFMEELIQREAARVAGKTIEQSALPAISTMMDEKFQAAITQLRNGLSEEMQQEMQAAKHDLLKEMKAKEQRSDDRLAALIVRAIREGGISRRMLFTVLSKEDPELALAAYEDAKAKVGKELAARVNEGAA